MTWAPALPPVADPAGALVRRSRALPSLDLGARACCDLELLLDGSFAPLPGFLGAADYRAVVESMRLSDGRLWPIPITLDVDAATAERAVAAGGLLLRDAEGVPLAVLDAPEAYRPDREAEAACVYGTSDRAHPGVRALKDAPEFALGGRVLGLASSRRGAFAHLRHSPAELKARFARAGWTRIVAFQTRNPLHRAHFELTLHAMERARARLLLHPVVGPTLPGDLNVAIRVRCCEALLPRYPEGAAMLSLLPLAMRMAGPREALWHALIRRNHGCTHFIVGRDHAGPGIGAHGKPFYQPFAAQALVAANQAEAGIEMVPFEEFVYAPRRARYVPATVLEPGEPSLRLSGTELRRRLRDGGEIPDWFTFPEVAQVLRRAHPVRRGLVVFFTGLSGAGKSTLADALRTHLQEETGRAVTLLDGDLARKHLSSELGYSREHRDLNVRRIGFVASEVARHGGIALCAAIAPYAEARRAVREMVTDAGGSFVEVHVSTPLDVCELRDRKGLYALARAGRLEAFTGISDPYEAPESPELRIDTSACTPAEAVAQLMRALVSMGFEPPR